MQPLIATVRATTVTAILWEGLTSNTCHIIFKIDLYLDIYSPPRWAVWPPIPHLRPFFLPLSYSRVWGTPQVSTSLMLKALTF
jgi:hypothetical protein